MVNISVIDKAVKLVVDLFEAEGIYEPTSALKVKAEKWFDKFGILDVQMLAAATIVGEYTDGVTVGDLLNWKEFYFPSTPIDETLARIGGYYCDEYMALINLNAREIEMAQRDIEWR